MYSDRGRRSEGPHASQGPGTTSCHRHLDGRTSFLGASGTGAYLHLRQKQRGPAGNREHQGTERPD